MDPFFFFFSQASLRYLFSSQVQPIFFYDCSLLTLALIFGPRGDFFSVRSRKSLDRKELDSSIILFSFLFLCKDDEEGEAQDLFTPHVFEGIHTQGYWGSSKYSLGASGHEVFWYNEPFESKITTWKMSSYPPPTLPVFQNISSGTSLVQHDRNQGCFDTLFYWPEEKSTQNRWRLYVIWGQFYGRDIEEVIRETEKSKFYADLETIQHHIIGVQPTRGNFVLLCYHGTFSNAI